MWGGYYEDDDRRAPYFYVTCPHCGVERRNDDEFCRCGRSAGSYSNADAVRWNRYADRQARGW